MNTSEKVWQEYHSRLRVFIKSRISDDAVTDDILQNVFLKMHIGLASLKDATKLQSWLYQIARNAIADYFRTHKSETELPESLMAPEDELGDKARREITECLLPMIHNLPAHYREAVMMAEIEGLPQKEVASKQNLSLSGAKSRIQRGRALVKDMLLECCRFEVGNKREIIDYERKKGECDCC